MPDVSLVSESIDWRCKWETWDELNSNDKPIKIEMECAKETNQEKKCITGHIIEGREESAFYA